MFVLTAPTLAEARGFLEGPWFPALIGAGGTLVVTLLARVFSRADKAEASQLKIIESSLGANVDVIKSLQLQVERLTERNTSLDRQRQEAESERQRAFSALSEAETKYKVLLGLLEERKQRAQPTTEGGLGEQ